MPRWPQTKTVGLMMKLTVRLDHDGTLPEHDFMLLTSLLWPLLMTVSFLRGLRQLEARRMHCHVRLHGLVFNEALYLREYRPPFPPPLTPVYVCMGT